MLEGLNAGGSVILDTRGSVGKYNADIQRQAALRAAEQKALQDQLGKVKIDGLRDADKSDYFKGFEDWRTTAQKATQTRDFREKANLQSEADKKYMELQSLVNKSKEYNRLHQDVSTKMLDDKFRDQFTDDAVSKWQESDKLPLSSSTIIKDPSTLARQLDLSKVDDKFAKADTDLLSKQQESNPVTGQRITAGNRKGTVLLHTTTVDPKKQAFNYGMLYDSDRDVKNFVRTNYKELYEKYPEDEAKALAIQDIISKRPIQKVRQSEVWDEKEDKFYEHYNYRLAHPIESGSGGVGIVQPINIPYAKGKANVEIKEYVPLSISKKNFAGSPTIDLKTGKPGARLSSSNDYEVVGVGNVPFITQGNMKGAISQPDFANSNPNAIQHKPVVHVQFKNAANMTEDAFIPYDRLPDNVKSSKQVREALGKFKPATEAPRSAKPTSAPKMITMVLPNGQSGQIPQAKVADFLKKYPKAKRQ